MYRNDAEGLRLERGTVEFTRIVEDVIRELWAMAEERQLHLHLGFGASSQWRPHRLWGDAAQLRRLVENLVINAIHHGLRGSRIQVDLDSNGSGLLLRVADEGPGVPEDEIPRLFQRFERLSEERPGSGLGLYLCRQIVTAHGGTIGLRNRPSGGVEIEVLLPTPCPKRRRREADRMRVLVVEDDELFRLGLEVTLLGFEGIEAVTPVADGEQALDLLREQRFDVVLLDLGLPGLGGMETCRRISLEQPQLPVLVVTSQEDPIWCRRMVRAGARGYVRKGWRQPTFSWRSSRCCGAPPGGTPMPPRPCGSWVRPGQRSRGHPVRRLPRVAHPEGAGGSRRHGAGVEQPADRRCVGHQPGHRAGAWAFDHAET